ncbi:MAG: hypothetical protein J2P33_04175 [Actinobacteria bacterium]|nr:hypothetical protein [Actinomycetota bacterium]
MGRYRLTGRVEDVLDTYDIPDIFLARAADGGPVTLTVLAAERAANTAARDRFTAEARAARQVAPFCAARVLDAGIDSPGPYLVTEYVPGPSLGEVAEGEGRLAADVLVPLAIGAATGLAAIHDAGLVHGSFGPDHVVLGPDGPRVILFSITPPYGTATPAADMLAWAQTVLFAALGRRATGPRDLAVLPEPLQAMVAACVAPDPAARPAARAVLAGLLGREDPAGGLFAEGTRLARRAAYTRPAVPPVPARPQRRRPGRVIAWTGACAACLAAIAVAAWFITGQRSDGADSPGGQARASASAPAARPSPAASIPAAMAGTWSGQVHQASPHLSVPVRITLTAGAAAGKISYPTLGCSGRLQAVPAAGTGTGTGVTLHQAIEAGRQNCGDGTVTLTGGPGRRLRFSYVPAGGGTGPAGTLTRRS